MTPLRVEVRRADVVESVHLVHAVAVQDGEVVERAGDPSVVAFMRSSSKPIQALPLVRARDDLDDAELAIASASHLADEPQLAAVRSLLAKAQASEDELECGPHAGERIRHNCSGKHAGMLALARTRGWDARDYRLPSHPVQQACLDAHREAAEAEPVATAVDGCGVVTFAFPLERMANAFSRFETLPGGRRIADAMRARPELIRGPRAADTMLMQTLRGWIAKGGAEGLLCAAGDGIGVALKVADGNARATGPAAAAFLARLGRDVPALLESPLTNSRGELVGALGVASSVDRKIFSPIS